MRTARTIALFVVLLCLCGGPSAAQSDCSEIYNTSNKGELLYPELLAKSGDPMVCIVNRLPAYFDIVSNKDLTFNNAKIRAYLSLTAAAISLVERVGGDYSQINRFRELDSIEVARTLAEGSRHRDRAVRINSARLFASVIDNETLCVALDYLHADVDESIVNSHTIRGRANLLGVVKPASRWVGKESQEAIKKVVSAVKREIEGLNPKQRANLGSTERLLRELEITYDPNAETKVSDDELSTCKNYEFKYWADGKSYYGNL